MMKHIGAGVILGIIICAILVSGCLSPSVRETGYEREIYESPEGGADLGAVESSGAEKLMFITEEYPPLNYVENGTIKGIAVDLLLGVFSQMDDTISVEHIRVLPWSRGYEIARARNNTAIFATVRLPEREDLFKWVGPLASERKVVFANPGRNIKIDNPADLKGYRIGVVRDDAAQIQLLALGLEESDLIAVGNVPALITLMQEGEIDLWCYGDLAGRYFAEQKTGDPGYFDVVYTLDKHDLYYAFSLGTPASTVDAFQSALDTLRYEPDSTGVTEYQRIMYRYTGVSCMHQPPVTADQVTGLVDLTVQCIETDAPGTISRINSGEHPFWDRDNRALYVFVYDTNTVIIAEADNPRLVGVDMKGKTDVAGTPFRDQITEKALAEGSGWVDYIWMVPEQNGIYYKSAYCRLVEGSDGEQYIVVSGMYRPCNEWAVE